MRKPRQCTVYHKSYNAEEMLNFVLVCGKHIFLGLVTKSVQNIWWNFSEMTRIAMSTVVQVDNDSIASLAKLSNETIKSVAAVFRTCNVPITTHHLSHLAWACQQHGPPAHVSTFPFERAINRYGRLIRPGPHDDIVPRLVARIVKHVDDVVPYVAGREFGVLTRCPVTPEKVDTIVTSVLTRENRGSPVTVFTAALRRAQLQGQVHVFKTLKMSLWGSRSVSLAKVGCEAVLQIGPVFAKPAMFWRVEQTIYVEIEVYYRPTGFEYGRNPVYTSRTPHTHEIALLEPFGCSGYCHALTPDQLEGLRQTFPLEDRPSSLNENLFIFVPWHLNMRD